MYECVVVLEEEDMFLAEERGNIRMVVRHCGATALW